MAMDATFLHGLEASNVVITLKAAYPLGAVVLLAFAVWVEAATGWHLDRTWTAAVAGLALAGVSSTAFLLETVSGSYSAGTIVDSLWLAGGLVLAYAAWQPSGGAMPIHLQGQRRLAVTSVGAAVALGVLRAGPDVLHRFRRGGAGGGGPDRPDLPRRGVVQGVAADVHARPHRGADGRAHRRSATGAS